MKKKLINFVKKSLPYRSIRYIEDKDVIEYIKIISKKINLYSIHNNEKIINEFLKNFIDWIKGSKLNKFKNLDKFKYKVFSNGTSQIFDMFYLKYRNKTFRILHGEYSYHFLSFRNHGLKWKYINGTKLKKNDALIISLPFSDSGNKHEKLSILLNECNKKNIPVFDDKILSLTKIFNDRVFEKYDFEYLLEGIHNLIAFNCDPCYVLKDMKAIKKQWFKEKNRMIILRLL